MRFVSVPLCECFTGTLCSILNVFKQTGKLRSAILGTEGWVSVVLNPLLQSCEDIAAHSMDHHERINRTYFPIALYLVL